MPFAPPVTTAVLPSNLVMAPTVYGPRMEFREILRRRRMHRAFLPDPIPREQIERIAGVIRRAPSGGFSQGGSIVVVTDDAVERELVERFEMSGTYADDAPVLMVISANESLYHARYNQPDKLGDHRAASRSRGLFPTGSSTRAP